MEKKIGENSLNGQFDTLRHLENYQNIIGHTRWATHGGISLKNTHPHLDTILQKFTIVHNGIIENYQEIKNFLQSQNVICHSETDSEILLNYIVYNITQENSIKNAIIKSLNNVEGTYGIVLQYIEEPNKLYCIRKGSPLIMGINDDLIIITSELSAFPNSIQKFSRLEKEKLYIFDINEPLNQHIETILYKKIEHSLGSFQYFTQKEIWEQKELVQKVSKNFSRIKNNTVKLGGLDLIKNKLHTDNIAFFGCGTSYHACCILQYFFLKYGHFKIVQCFDASNFDFLYLYKFFPIIGIFLSQSGETMDILKIIEKFNLKNISIGLTNVVDSQLSSLTSGGLYLNIGKERGVASTKSFTAQIIGGILILLWFISEHNHILLTHLSDLDKHISLFLNDTFSIISNNIIPRIMKYNNMFVIGRNIDFFVAKEGALKIKEISYKYAEAYASSSLKHGPLALLDENFLVIYISSNSEYIKKDKNTLQEILARKATILLISSEKFIDSENIIHISIPKHFYSFIFSSICLQIIAYELAVQSNINPDYPKNLAKVVTVE
jgi:glucosamine--fructose-6-phosphate aminotransferase (isomerizing)